MHGNKSAKVWRMPDALWERVQPFLPVHRNTHPLGGGRPRRDDRDAMDAIFHILRTGAQWNSLNVSGICSSSTAHRRFQEWVQAGVFWKLWCAGVMEYDALKGIDWSWLSGDGAMTKAPLAGEKNRPESHGSGQIRRQAQPAHRGSRRRDWNRGRRRQRQRLQAAARDPGEHSHRSSATASRTAAGHVSRQGIRLRRSA
jgi:transposase